MPRMRRRIRSAAVSLHRHSLPQLALDGVLVALAYFLAYRLRFDDLYPQRYEELYEATIVPSIVSALVLFAAFRLYQKWWRYSSLRDLESVVVAGLAAAFALVGYIAIVTPVERPSAEGNVGVSMPTSVLALYLLLLLAFTLGARLIARAGYERRFQTFRPRRDARGVLIVGAGGGGRLVLREILRNPELRLRPLGFVDD